MSFSNRRAYRLLALLGLTIEVNLMVQPGAASEPARKTTSIFGVELACPRDDPDYCAWDLKARKTRKTKDGSVWSMSFHPYKSGNGGLFGGWALTRTDANAVSSQALADREVSLIDADVSIPDAVARFQNGFSAEPIFRIHSRNEGDWLEINVTYRSAQGSEGERDTWWPPEFSIGRLWRIGVEGALSPVFRWPVQASNARDVRWTSFGPFVFSLNPSGSCGLSDLDTLVLGPRVPLLAEGDALRFATKQARKELAAQCKPRSAANDVRMNAVAAAGHRVACARWNGASTEEIERTIIAPFEYEYPCGGLGFLHRWANADFGEL